jgi:hypothetical protein
MAVSDKSWGQFSDSDYPDAGAFCDASLINLNTGTRSDWTKANCKLRLFEHDGDLNRNGVHAAAAVLAGGRGGVDAPASAKAAAAKRLVRLYGELKEPPPDSIRHLAGL